MRARGKAAKHRVQSSNGKHKSSWNLFSSHSNYKTEKPLDKQAVRHKAIRSTNHRKNEAKLLSQKRQYVEANSFCQDQFSEVEEADEQEEFDLPAR